jgi:ABC-type Co2+ transport system permease subunit
VTGFGWGLVLPTLVLAMLGWAVPRALALVWPEGVGPLMWLGLVATLLMLVLAAVVFAGLYALQGRAAGRAVPPRPLAGAWHFLRLGAPVGAGLGADPDPVGGGAAAALEDPDVVARLIEKGLMFGDLFRVDSPVLVERYRRA